MKEFRDIKQVPFYKDSFTLTLDIYKRTENFPSYDGYGLRTEIRLAAGLMSAKIAGGFGSGNKDLCCDNLGISLSSLHELETHLELAVVEGLLSEVEMKNYSARINQLSDTLVDLPITVKLGLNTDLEEFFYE